MCGFPADRFKLVLLGSECAAGVPCIGIINALEVMQTHLSDALAIFGG